MNEVNKFEDWASEGLEILEGLSGTQRFMSYYYLDYIIYFYFFLMLWLFLFIVFFKEEPFDKRIVKFYTLLVISIMGIMLFFKEYFYILYLFIGVLLFLIIKVREEIRQFFLIMNYKRKELGIDLGNYGNLDAAINAGENLYSRFAFVKTLSGLGNGLLKGWRYFSVFADKGFGIIISLNLITFAFLLLNMWALYSLYKTEFLYFN